MKLAALILGLIGSIVGLFTACGVGAIGGLGAALEAEGAGTVSGLAGVAFLFVVVGIVGAALSLAKPKVAGIMMLIAGLGGFIAVSAAWAPTGIMLIVAGVLALFGSRQGSAPNPAPPPAA